MDPVSNQTVLVVDDDDEIRHLVRGVLDRAGVRAGGPEAPGLRRAALPAGLRLQPQVRQSQPHAPRDDAAVPGRATASEVISETCLSYPFMMLTSARFHS